MELTLPSYNLNEFISEKCSLQKDEVKLIFENYKFITNIKYLLKKPQLELPENTNFSKYSKNSNHQINYSNKSQ